MDKVGKWFTSGSQEDFSEQMRENGHDGDLIERVAEVFDSFLAGDVDDIRDCYD